MSDPVPPDLEALSCVSCRARKLKCCRAKPACARCLKLKIDCVYPESRRKPAFKRKNVKDLEERLAQVEGLLKDAAAAATKAQDDGDGDGDGDAIIAQDNQPAASDSVVFPDTGYLAPGDGNVFTSPMSWSFDHNVDPSSGGGQGPGVPFSLPDMSYKPRTDHPTSWELLGMGGMFEALPPTEMIEELHNAYFTRQHTLIPIIHPARYMQAFYSAPHLRPPMALQYAVWTMASLGHDKYATYHDVFHRRCRHYLEEDELRGDGEHFVTVAHAQAWALMATAEARNMWFTRAAMSAARCIKLLHMMGLHRLDDDPGAESEMAPTIAPPKDWTELEERRRVFWGAFAIDSHASISTGWPCLIDPDDVTTHLPSSEEAFNQGRPEATCRLDDVFTGAHYSSFAAAAVICHLFNRIMKHLQHDARRRDGDNPHDYEYGKFWTRHRELDNLVSSAFMYLPEHFRLPRHLKDPVAVHTNLNLHASTICLHNRAYEMAIEHNLPEHVKMATKTRLETTAHEVVHIVKLTSHSNSGYRSPLVALALYVASSVYIAIVAEQGLKPLDKDNLEFLLLAMEALGKQHVITRSFLGQAIDDVHCAGLGSRVRLPKVRPVRPDMPNNDDGRTPAPCGSNIPIFARSRISKHNKIMPPLPGRLPLNNPIGRDLIRREEVSEIVFPPVHPAGPPSTTGVAPPEVPSSRFRGDEERQHAHKRKRVDKLTSPEPSDSAQAPSHDRSAAWFLPSRPVEEVSSSSDITPPPAAGAASGLSFGLGFDSGGDYVIPQQNHSSGGTQCSYSLPHRAGSSTTGSSPSAGAALHDSSSTSSSSGLFVGGGQTTSGTLCPVGENSCVPTEAEMLHIPGLHHHHDPSGSADLDMFQGFQGWDVSAGVNNDNGGGGGSGDGTSTGLVPSSSSSQQRQEQATEAEGLPQDGGFAMAAVLDDESWRMMLNDPAAILNGGGHHSSWASGGAGTSPGVSGIIDEG